MLNWTLNTCLLFCVQQEDRGEEFVDVGIEIYQEKIATLQKQLKRKSDKIDFLQDHVDQLFEEVHRKSKFVEEFIYFQMNTNLP